MAEPRAVTPSALADAQPDVLLATKLYVPQTRSGFVVRPGSLIGSPRHRAAR
jgi:hypothetical protein